MDTSIENSNVSNTVDTSTAVTDGHRPTAIQVNRMVAAQWPHHRSIVCLFDGPKCREDLPFVRRETAEIFDLLAASPEVSELRMPKRRLAHWDAQGQRSYLQPDGMVILAKRADGRPSIPPMLEAYGVTKRRCAIKVISRSASEEALERLHQQMEAWKQLTTVKLVLIHAADREIHPDRFIA
jgi:hypothetical protein